MISPKNRRLPVPAPPPGGSGTLLLSALYLAPIEYYSHLFHARKVVVELHENYQKQSYRNRCNIVGANGLMPLSIPVEKPSAAECRMKDIRIADHGNWRHLHWNAIVSAYNSTPFFEYYADELHPFYEKRIEFLADFNLQLHQLICKWLRIDTPFELSSEYVAEVTADVNDYREAIHPKRPSRFTILPYYQVFGRKLGFIQNASIIDLLFNMGNEARLWL